MEKKNKNKDIIIYLLITIIVLLLIIVVLLLQKPEKVEEVVTPTTYKDSIYNYNTYDKDNNYANKLLTTYEEYKKMTDYLNISSTLKEEDFKNIDYLVVEAVNDYCGGKIESLEKISSSKDEVSIRVNIKTSCGPCPEEGNLYLIEYPKNTLSAGVKVNLDYKSTNKPDCDPMVSYKPIIYLYPEEKTNIKVELGNKDKLTTTYPKYIDKWEVTAYPNGDLYDNNNNYYYALYWEGINTSAKGIRDTGFVIKGTDTIKFLEDKLSILGLNDRERNEFIMYWLPKLERNNYNYIYFETIEEINDNMPLSISPKPDTIIRILMEYKPLKDRIEVKEQELSKQNRKGYTLVEWGGTIIE